MAILLENSLFLHVPKTGGSWVREALRSNPSYLEITHPNYSVHLELTNVRKLLGGDTIPPGYVFHDAASCEVSLSLAEERLARFRSGEQLFTFAFVRHPAAWWPSFWRFRTTTHWEMQHAVDSICRADDLDQFVRNVLREIPGWCSTMYEKFVGSSEEPICFVGHQESLVDDLLTALKTADETINEQAIRSTAAQNVTSGKTNGNLDPFLKGRLFEAERRAIERFYPDSL